MIIKSKLEKNPYLIGNLKRLRNTYELSQQDIADKLGIDRSTYTYYETGKTEPSINMLSRILAIYNKCYGLCLSYDDVLCMVWSVDLNEKLDWYINSINSSDIVYSNCKNYL